MEKDSDNDKFYVHLNDIEHKCIINEINKIDFIFK